MKTKFNAATSTLSTAKLRAIVITVMTLLVIMPLVHIPPFSQIPVAHAATDGTSTGFLIPAYWAPNAPNGNFGTTSYLYDIIHAHNSYASVPFYVVINPGTGPCAGHCGSNANYLKEVKDLAGNGTIVLGYVPTGYCDENRGDAGQGTESNATVSTIETNMSYYETWYGSYIKGIFFDEMASPGSPSWNGDGKCYNGQTKEAFYSSLTTQAEDDGFTFTLGNPGTDLNSTYIGSTTIANIWESSTIPTNGSSSTTGLAGSGISSECSTWSGSTNGWIGWHLCYNKDNFSAIVYGQTSLSTVDSDIGQWTDFVGLVSVTDAGTASGACDVNVYAQPPGICSSQSSYLTTVLSDLDKTSAILTVESQTTSGTALSGANIYFAQSSFQGSFQSGSCTNKTCNEVHQGQTTTSGGIASIALNGSEPLSYSVYAGALSGYTFCDWSDGNTNNPRLVSSLSSSTTLKAQYTTSTCTTGTVTVDSVNQNGDGINGYSVDLYTYPDGSLVTSGFTNATFNVIDGDEYAVWPQNYQNCAFSHWADTNLIYAEREFYGSSGTQTFKAVYVCTPSGDSAITLQTADDTGHLITGYYTVLYNSAGTTIIADGYSTFTYSSLTGGTEYKIYPENYGGCDFYYWNDTGLTTNPRLFTAAADTNTLYDAIYSGLSCA